MSELTYAQPTSISETARETAKGVAIRAGVLAIGGIVVGGWLASVFLRAAGTLVKVLAGLLVALIAGGAIAFEVNRVKKRLQR